MRFPRDYDEDPKLFIDHISFSYLVWRGKEDQIKRNSMVVSI